MSDDDNDNDSIMTDSERSDEDDFDFDEDNGERPGIFFKMNGFSFKHLFDLIINGDKNIKLSIVFSYDKFTICQKTSDGLILYNVIIDGTKIDYYHYNINNDLSPEDEDFIPLHVISFPGERFVSIIKAIGKKDSFIFAWPINNHKFGIKIKKPKDDDNGTGAAQVSTITRDADTVDANPYEGVKPFIMIPTKIFADQMKHVKTQKCQSLIINCYKDKISLQGIGHSKEDKKFRFLFKHPLTIPKPKPIIIVGKDKKITTKNGSHPLITTIVLPNNIASKMEKLKNISDEHGKITFYFNPEDEDEKPLMLQVPISNLGTLQILIRVWKKE